MSRITQLVNWINANGRVPESTASDLTERQFGLTRKTLIQKRAQLKPEIITELESSNFWSWDYVVPRVYDTEVMIKRLSEYVQTNGRIPLQTDDNLTDEQRDLARWIVMKKNEKVNNCIHHSCCESLEAIPGWKWNSELTFSQAIEELKTFVATNSRLPMHNATDEAERLIGRWCVKQRQLMASSNLDQSSQDQLESVEGWSWNLPPPRPKNTIEERKQEEKKN